MNGDAAHRPPVVLSTDTVRERERLDYWRDIVRDTFVELECRAGADQGFYGSIESRDLGDIRLAKVSSTAQHVVRTGSRIARSDLEYFFLSLQLHGRGCHKHCCACPATSSRAGSPTPSA